MNKTTFVSIYCAALSLGFFFSNAGFAQSGASANSDKTSDNSALERPAADLTTTVVSVAAEDNVATEMSPLVNAFDSAKFRFSRTGDLSRDTLVFFSVSGSASAGEDYKDFGSTVRIPSGERSATIEVVPLDDPLREGVETVVVRLEPSPMVGPLPTYEISAANRLAVAVILDNDGDSKPALEIVTPREGEQFPAAGSIEIAAAAYDATRAIETVVFFADEEKIGESHVQFDRAFSGGLIVHRFTWTNPKPGQHVLTARGFVGDNDLAAVAAPVHIAIGDVPPEPVVRIEATRRIAEETSDPLERIRLTGEFTISRTGSTEQSLPVFVQYSGTATPDKDYPALPWRVTIPAGAASEKIQVAPNPDQITEGIETLVATISNCPPKTDPPMGIPCVAFAIDRAHQSATVFIRDDGVTQASVAIRQPASGDQFDPGQTIKIEAVAIDLNGYISRVDFWDGDNKIGVSEITFIRAPDPGTPIHHSFEWKDAAPGTHVLTARAVAGADLKLVSEPVKITVRPLLNRVVLDITATDPVGAEAGDDGRPDPILFTIRRVSGPKEVEVPVYYAVEGTAQNGIDYTELSGKITLPRDAESVRLTVTPIPDDAREGDESVVVALKSPVCIDIFPPPPECYEIASPGVAKGVIRDRAFTPASVAITNPKNGDRFDSGQTIKIEAVATDPNGYISRVEFWDGERRIGVSQIDFFRAPDPGTPIQHSFEWKDAAPGTHVLTARAAATDGVKVVSEPVKISVGPLVNPVVLEIEAVDAKGSETGPDGAPDPIVFVIRRAGGPQDVEVPVFYGVSGSAQNGVDYAELSGKITLPSGADAVKFLVTPIKDNLPEGEESVVVSLKAPACIEVFPPPPECYRIGAAGSARAVIVNGGPNLAPEIAITQPSPGALIPANEPMEIVAVATDRDGFVTKVEFFSDDRKIAEQNVESHRGMTIGGQQKFHFVWRNPSPGTHVLTARATDNSGQTTVAGAVEIKVAGADIVPVVRVIARDAFAKEPIPDRETNTATFVIHRFGPTNAELTVGYSLRGTADNGIDYEKLTGVATIPAGQRTAAVSVRPLPDNLNEIVETVILQLDEPASTTATSAAYRLGYPRVAAAVIFDSDLAESAGETRCIKVSHDWLDLCFDAKDGGHFRVEASDDFLNWETELDAEAIDGCVHFVQEMADAERKFYRIVPQTPPPPDD